MKFTLGKYTIVCDPQEEGGFSGQCIELPTAISEGETFEELKENMLAAINLVLESMNKGGELY